MDTLPIDYNDNSQAKPHHINTMLSENNIAEVTSIWK